MVICIIGGSGSGKDTQGKVLAQKLGLPHVSMGEVIRMETKKGNPVAVEASKLADKGIWVAGEIVTKLLTEHLLAEAPKGVVLNGYPRNTEQLGFFEQVLAAIGQKLAGVVHLNVPSEVLVDRMHKQKLAHPERPDLADEVIHQRLKSYQESIGSVLAHYEAEGQLVTVDGTKSIDEVSADMEAGLRAHGVQFPALP